MKVLITGASSGIGRDMARILATEYDEMILVARNEEELKKVKIELEGINNTHIKTCALDLSSVENCIKLHDENPNVDFLINNAGFGDCGKFDETDLSKEISMINTNITAYHILTKLYLKDMKKENKGQILNVASIAGFMPGPLMSTYYATKSYVVRLSEGLREELKRDNSKVRISILCPGPVSTNFDNVANVKFSMKSLNSEYVAKYALDHLDKFYIIPGLSIRLSRHILHLAPTSLVSKIIYNGQHRKISKD